MPYSHLTRPIITKLCSSHFAIANIKGKANFFKVVTGSLAAYLTLISAHEEDVNTLLNKTGK